MSQGFPFGEKINYAFKIKSALIPLWTRKCEVSGRPQRPGSNLDCHLLLCDLGQIN